MIFGLYCAPSRATSTRTTPPLRETLARASSCTSFHLPFGGSASSSAPSVPASRIQAERIASSDGYFACSHAFHCRASSSRNGLPRDGILPARPNFTSPWSSLLISIIATAGSSV